MALQKMLRLKALFVSVICLVLLLLLLWHFFPAQHTARLAREPENRSQSDAVAGSRKITSQLTTDLASIGQHVFSAYFDTRSTLGGRKFVRVITVLDTKAYTKEFSCQFMNRTGGFSFSRPARKSESGPGWPHGNHYYREFVLSCPVFEDFSAATFLFVQTDDASRRSQVIRVRHNPLSLGQEPHYPQLIINCVSVTFGRPSETRLIEWLEAQRLLKMDKVQLHFHHMQNKQFEAVAQAYIAEGFLDVRRLGCPFCEAGHEEKLALALMSVSLNQCFYENLGRYKFTAVYDLDEIIVPQQHSDYPSLLSDLELRFSTNSFVFRNWYHFTEFDEDSTVARQLHMLRHPFRTKDPSPVGFVPKSIHRSNCVVALHNHNNF